MIKTHWVILVCILTISLLCACKKDKGYMEIACHKDVMLGDWEVEEEFIEYFEMSGTTETGGNLFLASFYSDGSGSTTDDFFGVYYFTWGLQCTPNSLLINDVGNTPLDENDEKDPMNYIAFSNTYELTKLTKDEIQMTSEYFLGIDETRRKVTENLTYSRLE